MVKVSFRPSDFVRAVADEGVLTLRNRYFEQNPFLEETNTALIARPGMRRLTTVGEGPIRGMASQPGSFNGDMFIASGQELYRMDHLLTNTFIYAGLNAEGAPIKMAITAEIGDVPEFCYIADGVNLYIYMDNGYAMNVLTGTVANTDVVRLGSMYYRFTNAGVDVGTPDGTSGNPWLVKIGVVPVETYTNLANAINGTGVEGIDYSTGLQPNEDAMAVSYTSTSMGVRARLVGTPGNGVVSTETGASLNWTEGGTLSGGGSPSISQVMMPDDIGAIDVAVINSYVIVIPIQREGYQGRFYWIEPGETTVDPLNFATAERSPDGVYGVQVFGDQFWLPGESTTEVWYVAGGNALDPSAPVMQRLQGVVLDRGSWQNTAKAVHETMVIVDVYGGVFLVRGGSPERVSTPDIEEQIRKAIQLQDTEA